MFIKDLHLFCQPKLFKSNGQEEAAAADWTLNVVEVCTVSTLLYFVLYATNWQPIARVMKSAFGQQLIMGFQYSEE